MEEFIGSLHLSVNSYSYALPSMMSQISAVKKVFCLQLLSIKANLRQSEIFLELSRLHNNVVFLHFCLWLAAIFQHKVITR